jgi:hypothetical protein
MYTSYVELNTAHAVLQFFEHHNHLTCTFYPRISLTRNESTKPSTVTLRRDLSEHYEDEESGYRDSDLDVFMAVDSEDERRDKSLEFARTFSERCAAVISSPHTHSPTFPSLPPSMD